MGGGHLRVEDLYEEGRRAAHQRDEAGRQRRAQQREVCVDRVAHHEQLVRRPLRAGLVVARVVLVRIDADQGDVPLGERAVRVAPARNMHLAWVQGRGKGTGEE